MEVQETLIEVEDAPLAPECLVWDLGVWILVQGCLGWVPEVQILDHRLVPEVEILACRPDHQVTQTQLCRVEAQHIHNKDTIINK